MRQKLKEEDLSRQKKNDDKNIEWNGKREKLDIQTY
jgi:hypothetical protein